MSWDDFTDAPVTPGTARNRRVAARFFTGPPSGSCAGDPATAATAAGHRGCGGVRRAGQFRHARGDELPAEYAGTAIHGRHSVRMRRAAQRRRRAGEHLAGLGGVAWLGRPRPQDDVKRRTTWT